MTQLTISNLTSQYDGKAVINQLSLTLASNEIVALLGPSGCGKTTLLRTIAGLQPISHGEIKMGDQIISTPSLSLASEKRNIGMIFQDYALFPHLNVTKNIAFGLNKLEQSEQKKIVKEMLTLVKLEGYEDRYPHELSGGQQQRVAIARALAYKPQLMLLDEPFSNIDSQSRGEIMQEMRQILKKQQVPAVFVTHSKDEAFVFADKIAIFNAGKIEQIDQGSVLYAQPSSAYVANFMGKTNYVTINSINENSVTTCFGDLPLSEKHTSRSHNVVMLRPEQILIDEQSDHQFKVMQCSFAGSHWVYSTQAINDDSVFVEVHSHLMLEEQQVIGLSVNAHQLVTFKL
jgi:iron(III) transport system ATP-binding protein